MIENLNTRIAVVFLSIVMAVLYILPNFTTLPKDWWFKKEKLNYGLDIQGGAHLIYGVDVPGVLAEKTARLARSLTGDLKNKGITTDKVEPGTDHDSIVISYSDPTQK